MQQGAKWGQVAFFLLTNTAPMLGLQLHSNKYEMVERLMKGF